MCHAVPFAYLDGVNCVLYADTNGTTTGKYAVAIQIEDFKKASDTISMSMKKKLSWIFIYIFLNLNIN